MCALQGWKLSGAVRTSMRPLLLHAWIQHSSLQMRMPLKSAGSDDGFSDDDDDDGDGKNDDGKRTNKKKSKGVSLSLRTAETSHSGSCIYFPQQRHHLSRQGRIASEITREELSDCFGMPSEEAARRLGVGLTVLKRICRKFGVPRWPYRKLKSLDRLITNVEV